MPIVVIAGGAGLVAGLILGKGTEDLASLAKWGVIGGGVFVVAKVAKVI